MSETDTKIWMPQRVELWDIAKLIPYARNAKKHPEAQILKLMASIRQFGFVVPVLADSAGILLAGHGRVIAAERLGLQQAPVVVADHMTDDEKRLYVIADNKLAEGGIWDEEMLALEFGDLRTADLDLGLTGFDEKELLAFFPPENPEALEGEDECAAPLQAVTVAGDHWRIGPHRLICGDCRDQSIVQQLLGGVRLNLVVTSPPYASQRKYDPATDFKPIAPEAYVNWFRDVSDTVKAHLADDGSFFLNIKEHADGGQRSLYVKELVIAHVKMWGWLFIDEFCWRNTANGVPGGWKNRFKNAWEPIFHFGKTGQIKCLPDQVAHASAAAFDYDPAVNNNVAQVDKGKDEKYSPEKHKGRLKQGVARPSNVIETRAETNGNGHSAPYPVALPEFFVKAFTALGDTVYDPFLGSGTTMVAAHKHGRIGYGCELSPKYCDMIVGRMRKLFPDLPITLAGTTGTFEEIAEVRGMPIAHEAVKSSVKLPSGAARVGALFGSKPEVLQPL